MRFVWVFLIGTVFVFFPPRANAIPQPDNCYGITQTQVSGIFDMPMVRFLATPSPEYFINGIWRTNCNFLLTGGALSILMIPLDPRMTPEVFKESLKHPVGGGSNQVFSEMVDGVGLVAGFRWGENDTDLKLLVMTQGKGMLILSGGARKVDMRPILIQIAKQIIPMLRDDPIPKSDD